MQLKLRKIVPHIAILFTMLFCTLSFQETKPCVLLPAERIGVEAKEISGNGDYEVATAAEGIVPYKDEIITYYRNNNGVLQYRRWNATQGYWVDPDWIG